MNEHNFSDQVRNWKHRQIMLLDLQVMDLIICSACDNNKYTTKSFKVDMFSIASEPKHGREFLLPKMFSHETSLRKN